MHLVSIVVPALDEDLTEPLAALCEYLRGVPPWIVEIIVVDDSRDEVRTRGQDALRVARLPANVRARLVEGPRSGKGAAVRTGIRASEGDFVFVIDVDLPAPLDCIERFLRVLENGADVVIAERVIDRKFSSTMRWALSKGLRLIQRTLVFQSFRFSDTQCGFKAFRGALIRELASEQILDGGMYDLEYLYMALRRKQRIETIAIAAAPERRHSRINVWKCLRQDPVDVIRVKVHGMLGRYD
jgi:glycosyltransferase involved in cell wall biosynthesis